MGNRLPGYSRFTPNSFWKSFVLLFLSVLNFRFRNRSQAVGKSCFDKCMRTASSRNSTRGRATTPLRMIASFSPVVVGACSKLSTVRSLRRVSTFSSCSLQKRLPSENQKGRPHGYTLRPHCVRPVSRLNLSQSFNRNPCVLFVLTTPHTSFSTLSR